MPAEANSKTSALKEELDEGQQKVQALLNADKEINRPIGRKENPLHGCYD